MPVKCDLCNKEFSTVGNLNKHKRGVHNIEDNIIQSYDFNTNVYKCLEGCNVSCKTHANLIQHLEEIHNIIIKIRTLEFKQYRDFEIWRNVEERDKNVRYTRSSGSHLCNNKTTKKLYYECYRSGGKRRSDVMNRKRKLKKQGSVKMDNYCTSRIILSREIETGICLATYFETHYGHENDLEHLRLSDDLRKSVASQLLAGKTHKEILLSVKDHQVTQQRDLLLKSKDIINIKRSFNIVDENFHPEETVISGSYSSEIKLRHDLAIISSYRVDYKEKLFYVYSSDDECPYIVTARPGGPCCELKCVYCNICVHKFECTCKDFMKRALICVHIHFCFLNKTNIINGLYHYKEKGVKKNPIDLGKKESYCDAQPNENVIETQPNDPRPPDGINEEIFEVDQPQEIPMEQSDTVRESSDNESIHSDLDSDNVQTKRSKIREACLKLLHNIETKSYTSAEENFIHYQLGILNAIKTNSEHNIDDSSKRKSSDLNYCTVEEIKIVLVDE